MRHLTEHQIARIKRMRLDGHTSTHVAQVIGCTPTTVRRHAPGRPGKVPNDVLRDAFLRSPKSAGQVGQEIGWMWSTHGDSARVKRTLGLLHERNKNGSRSLRKMIDIDTAERLADALGVERWELGEPTEVAA